MGFQALLGWLEAVLRMPLSGLVPISTKELNVLFGDGLRNVIKPSVTLRESVIVFMSLLYLLLCCCLSTSRERYPRQEVF
jgi:hypothetical protein